MASNPSYKDRQRVELVQLRPKPGFVPNPLMRKARNSICLCGSGKKWKSCCLPGMPLYIPEDDLADHLKCLKDDAVEQGFACP